MNGRKIFLAFLLVDMLVFSAWAVAQTGLAGFVESLFLNPATVQVTVDLVIALGLGCAWMVADARRHGRSALPFVLAVPFVGSMALLAYLVLRPATSSQLAARPTARAVG